MWKGTLGARLKQIGAERLVGIVDRLAKDEELKAHARGALSAIAAVKPDLVAVKDRLVSAFSQGQASEATVEQRIVEGEIGRPVRPSADTYPAPKEPISDVLEAIGFPYDTVNAGGYMISYDETQYDTPLRNLRISVEALVPDTPRRIGGMYNVTSMPAGPKWYVLLERRGGRLPIAVRRIGPHSMGFRIDPVPLQDLPTLKAEPNY